MLNTFTRLDLTVTPAGANRLQWVVNSAWRPPASTAEFFVELGRAGDSWTRLNLTGITASNYYDDSTVFRFGLNPDYYYRVVFNSGGITGYSHPVNIYGSLSPTDWRVTAKLINKEYLRLRHASGVRGLYYKRREWGTTCTSCTDPDTKMVINTSCTACYGTGIVSGFYNPVELYTELVARAKDSKTAGVDTGTTTTSAKQFRCVAYPLVMSNDLWYDINRGIMYRVAASEQKAYFKDIPISLVFDATELPRERVEYGLTQTENAGWTSGTSEVF